MCWPLCSHSDGYAWRANRYTLYLPCSTWWMASYDDAIRQHVGFYCRFNGISVQMFIESQMLQQFENIRLCRKFLCLWFWLLLSNISADGKVFLEWSHLLFRRKTAAATYTVAMSINGRGREMTLSAATKQPMRHVYWDLNAPLNRGKKTDITWRDATNLRLSLHHHFTRDFMKNTLVHPAKNLIGI